MVSFSILVTLLAYLSSLLLWSYCLLLFGSMPFSNLFPFACWSLRVFQFPFFFSLVFSSVFSLFFFCFFFLAMTCRFSWWGSFFSPLWFWSTPLQILRCFLGVSVDLVLYYCLPYQDNPWSDVLTDDMTNSGANAPQLLSTALGYEWYWELFEIFFFKRRMKA